MIRHTVTLCLVVVAQAALGQKFSLGLRAGPSLTWVDFADTEVSSSNFSSEPKLGFTVGGVIAFPLKKDYAFLAEFGYSQRGRVVKFNDNTWENNATYRYIDLSMALRKSYNLKLKKDVYTRWFFNIGPNVNYWINGSGTVSTQALGSPYTVVFDTAPDTNFNNNYLINANRWYFGLDLGIGVEAKINKVQRIHTEFRFTYGHTNIGKKGSSSHLELLGFDDSLLASYKTMSLIVSYYFDFDKQKSKMGKSTKKKEVKRKR